jgi:hypothetical protein
MKARTLIGMLIAGKELRDMMDSQTESLAFLILQRQRELLEEARVHRDMILQFLISLDNPETHDELRETLHAAHADMADQVARYEEHVG